MSDRKDRSKPSDKDFANRPAPKPPAKDQTEIIRGNVGGTEPPPKKKG